MPIGTIEIVRAADLATVGSRLDAVFSGHSAGVCVRGFLEPAEVQQWRASLEAGETPKPSASFEQGGVSITLHGPLLEHSADTNSYCDLAEACRVAPSSLPDALKPAALEQRIRECLGQLTGGPAQCLPLGERLAAFGSIRWLGDGGFIGAHFELAMLRVPAVAKHAVPLINSDTVLSFLLPLAIPTRGGALELFDMYAEDVDPGIVFDRYAMARVDMDALTPLPVPLEPGDLCMFDAGRIFHHVSKVQAPPWRWTFGGFVARSAGGDRVYYWG